MLGPTSADGVTQVAASWHTAGPCYVPVKQVSSGGGPDSYHGAASGRSRGNSRLPLARICSMRSSPYVVPQLQGGAVAAAVELSHVTGVAGISGRVQEARQVPGRRSLQEQAELQQDQQ
jgi:hypothetical protein